MKKMMYPEKERYRIACEKFLEQHPEVKRRLDSLNPTAAEDIDITWEDYQQLELSQAFQKEAELMGIDGYELVMRYIADSEEELEIMRIEYYKGQAKAIGMTWEDYCKLNHLEKWL
jgi:hypothetical protein